MARTPTKTRRKNFRFPEGLLSWAEKYASDNNTNLTQVIKDMLTDLQGREMSRRVLFGTGGKTRGR